MLSYTSNSFFISERNQELDETFKRASNELAVLENRDIKEYINFLNGTRRFLIIEFSIKYLNVSCVTNT